jgi:hypothetical protein
MNFRLFRGWQIGRLLGMPGMRQLTLHVAPTRAQWGIGLVVALLFVLGLRTPALAPLLPHIDEFQQSYVGSVSLFSVGFQSWMTSWFLFQLYHLLKHRFFAARLAETPLVNAFDKRVLVVALLLSAFSWYGIMVGMSSALGTEPPSRGWIVFGLLTGSTGTALYIYLGMLLDRIKQGYGFWLLILMQALYNAGTGLPAVLTILGDGTLSRNALLLAAALLLCSVVLAVVMLRPRVDMRNASPRHIFALCLLSSSLAMLAAPAIYLGLNWMVPTYAAVDPATLQGLAVGLLVSAIEIASLLLAAWLMFGRLRAVLARWDIVAGLAAMTVVTELTFRLGTGIWPGFWPLHFVLLAWAAKALRAAFQGEALPSPIIATPEDMRFDKDFRRGWR